MAWTEITRQQYPSAKVEAVTGGFRLQASPPPIMKTQIVVSVPFKPLRG